MARGLVWFRTDLRLDDNPALSSALSQCEEVLAIYVFSEAQWASITNQILNKNS